MYSFPNIFTTNFVNIGGANPANGLLLSGNTLYGTTVGGGQAVGDVYSLTLTSSPVPIALQAQISAGKFVLTWTNTGFTLQSAPNLNVAFTNIAGAASPYTNTSTASQQFFRL